MTPSIDQWGPAQYADPTFRKQLSSDPENVTGLVHLQLADGVIEVDKRMALINLFMFPILLEFGIQPAKRHYLQYTALTADSMAQGLQIYYEEIMGLDVHNAKRLKRAIWDMLQELYHFCCEDLLAYISTIDMMDMAEIMAEEPMQKILATKSKIVPEVGTDVIEKHIDTQNKKIMSLLKTPGALKNEALLTFSMCGQLNKFQVPQTMYAFGVRTDVSDNIISYPVRGSALDGLENICEFAAESLSAKKSAFYNHMAVAGSQYFGRKQHLLVSSIRYLYHGDCGSTVLVNFSVTEKNCMNLIGKIAYIEGQPVVISRSNIRHFIGKTIAMRSPMTCRYRKGVCEVCGGKVMANVNRRLNAGILSAVHMIEPTTQKILSAKHLIKTKSIVYTLPKQAAEILYLSSTNEIRWRPEFSERLPKLQIGIPQSACPNIHDVLLLRADKQPKEERFSEISYFQLRDLNGKEATYQLENDDQVPFFGADMLLYIRDHFNEVKTDESMVWIPLKGTDKFPIFKTIVVNDNMLQFVSRVSKFLSDDIKNYTSCSKALQDFSDVIHDKVSANIVHLETVLKAYQITSESDYRVPRVTDPEDVHFQTTAAILNNRHVGTKLAYQGLTQYLTQAPTYLLPKMASCFDLMVGY